MDGTAPIRVGLVGAGPWAKMAHAPVFAAGPETVLAGVWARRPEAAERLATRYGAATFASPHELFDNCDVVSFAVPPDVQATLAADAARAGKPVVLEKPIAGDAAAAERLAATIADAGVASLVVLSWRYAELVRSFLEQAAAGTWMGGRGVLVSGAFVGDSVFKTPWRLERGPLLDLGPHVLDLLDAALGPIAETTARGDRHGIVALVCEHEGGAVSEALLSACVPGSARSGVELFGPGGDLAIDCASAVGPPAFATLRAELASLVRDGRPPDAGGPVDVGRGLHLQRIIEDADRQLR